MSLDLSPRPGAAPFPRMVAAQAAMEARLMLRNGEQLLLAVVIPVIVLIGGVTGADHLDLGLSHRPVDVFTPGVLALAVMSTAFTSLAIATGFERRYGVIKRLGSSPLPRSGLLAGKVGGLLVVEVLQVAVVSVVGLLLGWDPANGSVGGFLAVRARDRCVRGARPVRRRRAPCRGDARCREPDLPAAPRRAARSCCPARRTARSGDVTRWLPSGALGEAMRHACLDGGVAWRDLGVLLVWGASGTALTARTFRWE